MRKIIKVSDSKANIHHNKQNKRLVSFLTAGMLLVVCAQFLTPLMANTLDSKQSQLFINNCVQCHTQADTGAPVIGVESDWVGVKAKSEDAILKNVIQGLRGMPPLGYCSACSKEDFRVLIRLMTNTTEKRTK